MHQVRTGIWFAGNAAWLFGLSDRTIAALMDGVVSALDLILLSTAALLCVGWLFLIPLGGNDD